MPSFEITAPNGKKYRVDGPEGSTAEQALAQVQKQLGVPAAAAPETKTTIGQDLKQVAIDAIAGPVRGAAGIGTTLMWPVDKMHDMIAGDRGPTIKGLITGKQPLSRNEERRASLDQTLRDEFGANPDSLMYQGSKLATEVAGTMGAGGAVANVAARAAPALAATATGGKLLTSIASGGFKTGAPAAANALGRAADLGIRTVGGAVNGGVSLGMVNPDDTAMGTGVGAVLPGGAKLVAATGKKLGTSIAGAIPQEVKDLAIRAKQLGIDVPLDRIANSKPLNALAASLNYVPMSGRAATESRMQSQLNRALSKTFGQDTDNVTQGLRKAREKLGDEFDRVLQANQVRVDQPFLDALVQAEGRAVAELGTDGARIIKNQIDEIIGKAGTGSIDGQAAYNIKRTLDRIGKRNSPEAFYASDLKRDLMEALNRSMTPDAAAAFATTRKQYGNMLSLDKLAQNGVDGDVSIARIANMKNIGNKDLQELADISAQFLKGREGQHGAMQRAGLGLGAATIGGPAALVGGMAAGRAGNMALNSNMLKSLALGQPNGARNRLLDLVTSPGAQQLGYRAAPVLPSD
jgi:hypothetical protein